MTTSRSDDYIEHALHMSGAESRFLAPGEALVGFGFRCWLGGYRSGNYHSLERCRSHFICKLGTAADPALDDLANWVDAVRCCSIRDIELLPEDCRSFCRDECLAVALVAAGEHRECPALQICAYMLMGGQNIEPALTAAERFSQTLAVSGVSFQNAPSVPTQAPPLQ